MEEKRILAIGALLLAGALLSGGIIEWRIAASRSLAIARNRVAVADAAARGFSHALACLNRTWPSEDCGKRYGSEYGGQRDLAYEAGIDTDISVIASGSDTREIEVVSSRADVKAATQTRLVGQAVRSGSAPEADDAPSLVGSGDFGWRLRERPAYAPS